VLAGGGRCRRSARGHVGGFCGVEAVQAGERPRAAKPHDLVNRNFRPLAPDRLWVADVTYVSTWSGWCYTAFVIGAYGRRILGWSVATTMTSQLVVVAVEQGGPSLSEWVGGVAAAAQAPADRAPRAAAMRRLRRRVCARQRLALARYAYRSEGPSGSVSVASGSAGPAVSIWS
jgi:transposase InsO family protein